MAREGDEGTKAATVLRWCFTSKEHGATQRVQARISDAMVLLLHPKIFKKDTLDTFAVVHEA